MMNIPDKIRLMRAARGWTQAYLSEKSGIPINYISAIESNAIPRYERRLLEELGYRPDMDEMLSEITNGEAAA